MLFSEGRSGLVPTKLRESPEGQRAAGVRVVRGGAWSEKCDREGRPKVPSDLAGLVYLDLSPEKKHWARAQLVRWTQYLEQKGKQPQSTRTAEESPLTAEEAVALGVILTDPRAGDRGVWTYPLHQQLTY